MPAIIWMAGLAIVLTVILGVAALNHLTNSDRRFYWLILAGIPSSFVVNRLVKIPLITEIGALAGIPLKLGPEMPLWFIAMIWLVAPVMEEAIKILPMALPVSRRFLGGANQASWAGLALGLGFGLGRWLTLHTGWREARIQIPCRGTCSWVSPQTA